MRGLRVDSYGLFWVSLAFYLVFSLSHLAHAVKILEPFILINLAHYTWYLLKENRPLADSLGIVFLIHWLYQVILLLNQSVVSSLVSLLAIVASHLWMVSAFPLRAGAKGLLWAAILVSLIGVFGYAFTKEPYLLLMIGCGQLVAFRAVKIGGLDSLQMILGNSLVILAVLVRGFYQYPQNNFYSLALVILYVFGHWIVSISGRSYVSAADKATTASPSFVNIR